MDVTPVIQVVGYKNSGKTTTTCELIKRFTRSGIRVGSIKHDAHDFEVDYPGKDTWMHREAGATVVAISSQTKTAFMEQKGTSLEELIARMTDMELIIVEGYKFSEYPKVVLLRDERDLSLVDQTKGTISIASWFAHTHPTIPVVHHDDWEALFGIVSDFLCKNYGGQNEKFCHC